MAKDRHYVGIRTYLPDNPEPATQDSKTSIDAINTKASLGAIGFDWRRRYKLFADSKFYVLGRRSRDYFLAICEGVGLVAASVIALCNFPNHKAIGIFFLIFIWGCIRLLMWSWPVIFRTLQKLWGLK